MKMSKIDLKCGVSVATLAELHGGANMPTFTAASLLTDLGLDANAAVVDDVPNAPEAAAKEPGVRAVSDTDRSVSDGSAPATVVPPRVGRGGDDAASEVASVRAMCEAEIASRLAGETTPERVRLLGTLREVNDSAERRLPRAGHKYSVRATLALAGVGYHQFLRQGALREDLGRLAPLFDLEDQVSLQVRGGPRAETTVGLGREMMDGWERDGIAVMRRWANSRVPSVEWMSKVSGTPVYTLRGSVLFMGELKERLDSGRLALGGVFHDPDAPSRAERKAARVVLRKLLLGYAKAGRPIPASSERGNKIDLDWLLDEAGITDLRLREAMKADESFRAELAAVIRKVKLKPVHLSRIDPRMVSYARLAEGGQPLLRQIYRADTPDAEADSVREDRWVANQTSFLSRFRKVNEREASDDAVADLQGEGYEEARALGHTASVQGNVAFDQGMDRWKGIATALMRATQFPASFAGALDAGMVATGRTVREIAVAAGCTRQLVQEWRHGRCTPTYQNVHLVAKIELCLGLVPNMLAERLPRIRSSRTMYGGRKEVTLADGRVVKLSGMWRYMHRDAPTWPEERLRAHVEEAYERVWGSDTAHRVRQRAAMTNAYGLPDPDPSSPIWAELDDLVGFQTGLIGDGRLRHPNSEWRSDATVKLHRGQVTIFARWLMMAEEKGGAGFPAGRVSLSLVLHHELVLRYVVWRVVRGEHLQVDDKPIGPKITSTDKGLLSFFASLVDPVFGWLTQSSHVVLKPEVDERMFRVPHVRNGKTGLDIVDDDTCRTRAYMPIDIVEAADRDWTALAARSNAHLRSTQARFATSFKMMRDPQQLMMPILRHQFPIAVGLRMARQALEHARPIETSPHLHAADVQRTLAFILLLLVVFRSMTMRELTWKADGTGNVRKLGSGYEIVVGAESFKNGWNPELFGPSWNRRDYERTLGNWGGLNEVLDHFITKCRPILLAGRESDLLFPPPKGRVDWSDSNFNHLIMSFSRKWCVYNPQFKTGMHGVRAFGPHPARNIVATHIIRNHPTEDRWRLASIVLCTGIPQVKQRYGWATSREELAKTDYLFQEASDIAASDAALY